MSAVMKRFGWIVVAFFAVSACVDPVYFDAPPPQNIVVVDGEINDDAGPYTVKILRGMALDADTSKVDYVSGAQIVLHSDVGETEEFHEVAEGIYQTGGTIRGTIGNSYYIDLRMPDGATFTSEPEKIMPAGEVTDIRFQFEPRIKKTTYGDLPADVFNIFIDAVSAATNKTSYVRWRFRGTYKTGTNPEYHKTYLSGFYYFKTPWPCSGWEVDPADGGGILTRKRDCTCCTCYVKDYDSTPRLSDNELVSGGEFNNVKVAEVPITRATFYEKYRVEIEQMTITQKAFDFFKIIRAQKDGASNLFQPPPGQLRGNINAVNADYQVIGLFWATSIKRKAIYITADDLPYRIARDTIVYPCTDIYANSTTIKPDYWDE